MSRFLPIVFEGLDVSTHCGTNGESHWVHLLPPGVFHGRDGRGPFNLEDAEAVIANSMSYASGESIPIDYDHQIDNAKTNGQPAIAAGWIKALEARSSGIWGLVAWTAKAAAHIAAKEYRFLSPVIGISKQNAGSVTLILRAALTNNPNLTQLEAIAAMEAETMNDFLQRIVELLGLKEGATEDDILASLQNRLSNPKGGQLSKGKNPDPSKWVPIAEFEKVVAELNKLNQGVERQSAVAHVEETIRAGCLAPALRNWGIELCAVNKPAFDEFVGKTKKVFAPLFKSVLPADYVEKNSASNLSEAESSTAKLLNLTPEEFMRGKRGNA